MKQPKQSRHFGLILLFALILFLTLLIHTVITGVFLYLLEKNTTNSLTGITPEDIARVTMLLAAVSIPTGIIVAMMASKFPLKPIRDLINGMDRLASGDFSTRISAGVIMRRYPSYVGVTESFNKMAEELENTELLRSDFVNNFSHEFKTPIVSIAGFARLLRRGGLSAQQQKEYLEAIEEESLRLSEMATNVLNLTRVENQTILTDVTRYNLSEQLRSCVLLLERKWSGKDLELQLEFGEHTIRADEELLKQVWINLLDNAIKFAPEGHTVQIRINELEKALRVEIRNTGSQIPPEKLEYVFHKFYQADKSHASRGNGVGLAIVKRIVELHGGTVAADSREDVTAFTVVLPK